MAAGFQVPFIPFVDVPGKAGAALFWHKGPIAAKAGVSNGSTVISWVVLTAHCPTSGVKVYVVVPGADVLTVPGLQVPVTLFVDEAGSDGATLF